MSNIMKKTAITALASMTLIGSLGATANAATTTVLKDNTPSITQQAVLAQDIAATTDVKVVNNRRFNSRRGFNRGFNNRGFNRGFNNRRGFSNRGFNRGFNNRRSFNNRGFRNRGFNRGFSSFGFGFSSGGFGRGFGGGYYGY